MEEKQQEARENVEEGKEEGWRGWIQRVKGREERGGKEEEGEVGGDEGGRGEW